MEIRQSNKEQGPIVAAVLALILLGLGSLFLTWQSIERQRRIVDEHMVLSGRAILSGVEANLSRAMRGLRQSPNMAGAARSLIKELLQELATSDDIAFAGIYGPDGGLLISSGKDSEESKPGLPAEALESLERDGFWFGLALIGNKRVLLSGLQARPGLSMFCNFAGRPHESEEEPGLGRGRGGMGFGRHQGGEAPPVYLVVGLNAERHLTQFNQYRRAALIQTGYVLLAAIVLWSLAFAYLRRREQAQKLVRLEQFQSKLLDHMPDGLVTLGSNGEILAANGSAVRLLCSEDCKDAACLAGRNWSEFPFPAGQGRPEWRQHEYRGQLLEVLALPYRNAEEEKGAPDSLVLIRDRTEIRALEEDLNEARRLAAIGSLAAGVAHEVRNPLSSLRGFAQLFADKLKGQKPLDSYAATMVQEADRLNRVVTDLLFLARPRELAPAEIDLAQAGATLFDLLKLDLEHKHVAATLDLEAPTVHADPDGLRQVLLNLAVNSLEALGEEGGRIEISSRRNGSGVWITVTDNGPGMPEEVRRQALEPFFTAKTQGTGLGLAIVQTIMRGHKGKVLIESEPGRGASVKLFFPDPAPAAETTETL
ncbi:MAG TPA: ATP-binding protein [Desulfovibrio sp.]|jgi:two-component system sensor histidine kinase HydH|uniref:two-component system sensor histidine kinase NtrB n=1 Tax=Desulfovibrio TaxID=872 RepID=UPI0004143EB6|nr:MULTISPECIES: ATP-binding protein [Desulfovibrio]MDY0306765.1 ATP-binding protein [Desulfovibrionaceae bacterium]HMM39680.1 ATP-binding protein [Desulfovibrio sp.]